MAMVLLSAAISCTTNNGNIGEWMGRWKLTEIECNGSVVNDYEGNMFFAFQSTVFEVRKVGEKLGIPHELVWRQPFPGPGLGVRIIGEITEEKVKILQNAMF